MNHDAVYQNIIARAQGEDRGKPGHERHHIIPKSLGGSNRKENLVLLTPKEHFLCHLLLTKMFSGEARKKMCWALHRMAHGKGRKLSAGEYDMARKIHSANMCAPKSVETRDRMRGPKTAEHAENIREAVKVSWETRSRNRSPESTEKWVATMRERFPDGVSAGKSPTRETRNKISEALRGRSPSRRTRAKLSAACSGDKNPNFGKTHSEETKAKMRAALARRKAATELNKENNDGV